MSRPDEQADPDPQEIGGSHQPHGLRDSWRVLHEMAQAERHQGRLKEAGHGDSHGAPDTGSDAARERM
jgi:hypothetical protein